MDVTMTLVQQEETPFGARGKNRGGGMSGSDPVLVRPMILPPPPTVFPSWTPFPLSLFPILPHVYCVAL